MAKSDLNPMESYFFHLGLLTSYWNKAEERVDLLLTNFINSAQIAHIVTHGAQAARRAELLKNIADECCKEDPWQKTLLAAMEAFDRLRRNRNIVVHGLADTLQVTAGAMELVTATQNPKAKTLTSTRVTGKQVFDQLEQVVQWVHHMDELRSHIFHNTGAAAKLQDILRERAPLPDKFPLPELLQSPEIQKPKGPQVRRVSSKPKPWAQ
jgi:hypothetical protein